MTFLIQLLLVVGGSISSALRLYGGARLYEIGTALTRLRSVGGETVAENYYQAVGLYGQGASMIVIGLAVAVFILSIGLANLIGKKAK
jgi:hypothetical protein